MKYTNRERKILCDFTYIWNLKHKTNNQTKHRYREPLVARGERVCGLSPMGEGDQEVQTSAYKIGKSWGCNVHQEDRSQ